MTCFVHHSAEIFGRLSERNRSNSAVAVFKRSFMEAFDFDGMRIADIVRISVSPHDSLRKRATHDRACVIVLALLSRAVTSMQLLG